MDFERFVQLLRALEREAVEYVLVGGVAVNLCGIVRATEDVDLFIRPERANVERLKAALKSVWEDPEIDGISFDDFSGEYTTLRYGPPDETLVIDVLTRLGTRFCFEDLESQTILVEGVPAVVATPATLVRMKKDTVRPIDKADAAALGAKFGIEDD